MLRKGRNFSERVTSGSLGKKLPGIGANFSLSAAVSSFFPDLFCLCGASLLSPLGSVGLEVGIVSVVKHKVEGFQEHFAA